ncbi:hypothetical protein [Burkholderia sp. S171]|uniref:hypothetical protein n=1 Tax=Burkholderia sp. S171 TaxID=1641860 RepID=UPI00131DD0CB|nr:hypothetical protein [Burkholderia sp. S171]
MTELDSSTAASGTAIGLPYFTEPDPALSRSSGGRDPLGLLPVWSAFGRKLVPYVASPVAQVNGIKAVVLIQWLANEQEKLRPLLAGDDAPRKFFRLMEGLVEFWLYHNDRPYCFGNITLAAEKNDFYVTTKTGKTVANGLYQYYRGTSRRAGLVNDNWKVKPELCKELNRHWTAKATDELLGALTGPIGNAKTALVPDRHLDGTALSKALKRIFDDDTLLPTLQESLFGQDFQRTLARDFLVLRRTSATENLRFDQRIRLLQSEALEDDIDCVLCCEPFLLVMQDVFDFLRGSPGKRLEQLARELEAMFSRMRERAAAFQQLGSELETPRMKQMQVLADILAASAPSANSAANRTCLIAFTHELVDYHKRCMTDRGRDPLVLIEGDVIVLPVAGDRDPQDAKKRLVDGFPWMNDYYLNTASNLYAQVFGEPV